MGLLAAGEEGDDQPVEGIERGARHPGERRGAGGGELLDHDQGAGIDQDDVVDSAGSPAGSVAAPLLAVPMPGTLEQGSDRNPLITSFISGAPRVAARALRLAQRRPRSLGWRSWVTMGERGTPAPS